MTAARQVCSISVALLWLPSLLCAADTGWVQAARPTFQVFSDGSPKALRATLGDLEQFRFALGQVLGSELKLSPAIQVVLFRDAQELEAEGVLAGIVEGRAHKMLVGVAGQYPSPAAWEQLARLLITSNVARLPANYEQGIESFFSTVKVNGANVQWGALPASTERTRDWARIHMLAVTPEYSGRLRVLLFNLQRGVPPDAAWPNAYGKSAATMEHEVDVYLQAGKFPTSEGPSTALSPDRDFYLKAVAPTQIALLHADLLTSQSPGRYEQMLRTHQNIAEAEEGLGLLAQRAGDLEAACQHWLKAMDAGSKSDVVMVAYARIEKQPARAREALDEAIRLNPNSAEAHYLLGGKASDPEQRSKEYAAATRLAPQNLGYWEALARWQLDQKQFGAAAKSWTSAEQAATNDRDREKMHSARMAIEAQRLDFEQADHERVAAEKQAALDKLKAQALTELHAAESRANQGKAALGSAAQPMEWPENGPTMATAEGTLLRVECQVKSARLLIQTKQAAPLRLLVSDLTQSGLTCGPGHARRIAVEFTPKPGKRTGTDGVLATVTFH